MTSRWIPWGIALLAWSTAGWLLHQRRADRFALIEQASLHDLRSRADQAFCDGAFAEALDLYGELSARTGDSSLYLQRAERVSAWKASTDPDSSLEGTLLSLGAQNTMLQEQLREHAQERRALEARLLRESDAAREAQPSPVPTAGTPPAPATSLLRMRTGKKNEEVIYLGGTHNGKAEGFGIGVWRSGSVYEGDWVGGQRHGEGVFQWADGERYEGGYINDKRTGQGTYHWQNGQRWTGQWENDMRHGPGVLYETNGKVRVEGTWQKDRLLSSSKAPQRTRSAE